ncbi:LOW QUALITY PROTEIN: gamma-tubulin complex component 6 [Tachyglossus aculeatus]|uniref:LOW QUALITY PROTEIN: gamma-tubulin complex component 6 n=1 Tax=Tachyglossus aculeatus TaxID=9261 RepID=UPI0018F69DEC|nr:LOW QUALITY PROTEIN: gamma-tubulin complex component 6 [Tachyglossus aculeatus]
MSGPGTALPVEMAGITQLLGDLCEAHLSGVSWGTSLGRRPVSKDRARRGLKRVAYDALFANLFRDEARQGPSGLARFPVKNQVLMLSFDLRVGGLGPEADRLEALVEELEASPLLPFAEVQAVLGLLVLLSGTGPPRPLPRKRDYFLNNRHAGRNVGHRGYDDYDVSVFEADVRSLIADEESQCRDAIHKSLRVMEAAPGTGLPALGLLSQSLSVGDRFERETRVSLFGALVHSRTYDMDIRLDLPPVPDSADLSGLAIKVPQSIDPSEDEGFQSASNLTPDSQSEPSVTPDVDLWDAVLTYGPSKRRCWERIGCPPGKKEEPFLTEAGREAFDHFYRLREGELQVLSGSFLQPPPLVLLKERQLVKDALNVLIGVGSATFSLDQATQAFAVKAGVYVSGASPESVSSLLGEVADCGTCYTRLSRFSLQPVLDSSYDKGLVFQAFTSGLRKYLQYYRACVLSTSPTLSLLTISFLFKKLGRQLRYLAELCGIGPTVAGPGEGAGARPFPTGVKLLSYLYEEALNNCSNEYYPVLLSLLKTSCEPYTRFIYDWVYSGVFRDTYGEFMIQVNEEYLSFRDKHYWTHGYVLISKEVEDCVPVFLKHIANDVYICGKTINLLKLCCPGHYICSSDIPVPRISVIFSLEELKEIERDCALYVGRMERIARYSSVSKEEKGLRMDIAKQELATHAREAAKEALKAVSDRQTAARMALDAKKRRQFQKLKEQFERDRERRLAAKQEEADDDFGYARELRERESRLKALEEELERKARQELMERYGKLSAEAAGREQRALWAVQRHRLDAARLSFLLADQKRIQEMLDSVAQGEAPGGSEPEGAAGPAGEGPALAPQTLPAGLEPAGHPGQLSLPSPATPAAVHTPEAEEAAAEGALPASDSSLNLSDFLPGPAQAQAPIPVPRLEDALQAVGTGPTPAPAPTGDGEAPEGSREVDYDFSSVLRPTAGAPPSPGAACGEAARPVPDPPGHPSGSRIRVGEGPSEVQGARPHWNGPGAAARSEAGGYAADAGASRPRGSLHGHVSDANIRVGDYVSEVASARPRWNVFGHVSDASIRVGENVSEAAPARPRWSVHGHASDANIKVGEYVSEVVPSRPRWNIHGHASDANIKVGDYMSEAASARPRWSVHGHASDANIKVGEYVSEVVPARPRWNVHGHASDANIKVGDYVSEAAPARPRWSVHGHASAAAVRVGIHVSEAAPARARGLPSRASAQLGERTLSVDGAPDPDSSVQPCDTSSRGAADEGRGPRESALKAEGPASGSTSGATAEPVPTGDESEDLSPNQPPAPKLEDPGGPRGAEAETEEGEEGQDATWKKEQSYLRALAEQYCLEKYRDSYELMSEPPVSHLLHHVVPRAFSFLADPQAQPDADATAVQLSELLSLPVLMKHSITAPLVSHVSLVNKAIVDYFFVELNVEKHFAALRHFLLMEDGEFAQSLSDMLFEKLGSGQTPGELLNPLVLNSLLNKALQCSLHGDSRLAANLSFALKYLPAAFAPNAPDALSCLELRYKVDWPLNIVITGSCVNKYNKIFSFLLQLKHVTWTLKDVCVHLKRTALLHPASGSAQFRQLQLYKHEMQHFVKVIQGYIATQILHVTWCEFGNKLASVANLEDIHHTHAEYLNKAIFRGLLTEKAVPVMNIIHSIFSLVLKFRTQLVSRAWSPDPSGRSLQHPNFALIQQSYNTFKYYSHFLFKVVTKLVNRGYQPHLEDFLLRINFNNYYRDT